MKRPRNTLCVGELMTATPVTVTTSDPLKAAFDLMAKHNIRELPVVENGHLIGIVTDRDLRQVAPSYPLFRGEEEIRSYMDQMKVATAMTPDPLVVSPETSVIEAAKLLRTYRVSSLPVIKEKQLVGIISVTDLLKLFIEQNEGAVRP
jgi:acetoin utilization protein AcuB